MRFNEERIFEAIVDRFHVVGQFPCNEINDAALQLFVRERGHFFVIQMLCVARISINLFDFAVIWFAGDDNFRIVSIQFQLLWIIVLHRGAESNFIIRRDWNAIYFDHRFDNDVDNNIVQNSMTHTGHEYCYLQTSVNELS